MKPRIVLAGSGYISVEIYETAVSLGFEVINYDPLGKSRIPETKSIHSQELNEELLALPIIMGTTDYSEFDIYPTDRRAILNRTKLFHDIELAGFKNWTSIIHPSAVVSSSATIGSNVFINANATIANHATVSNNTQINRNVSVGHDVVIQSFCSIGPGVTITGGTVINANVFIGAGATIINAAHVGVGATVGAGSLVTRHVLDATVVIGSPARIRS